MKILKIISVNILILLALVISTEIVLRILFPNFWPYKRTYPNQFSDRAFDKDYIKVNWPKKNIGLGWVCKQDSMLQFSNRFYNRFPIKYKINKEGFRNKQDFSSLDNSLANKRVLLLGDSFIMSVYLEEEKTITEQIKKIAPEKYQIYNLGIPGYGIDQSILAYEKYNNQISPNYVILFFIDDDIPRVLESFRKVEGMNKPSFDIVYNKLQLRVNELPGVFDIIFENSYLLNRFYKKYMDYYSIEISKKLFERLNASTENSNQKLIIVRCPLRETLLNKNKNEFYSFSEFCKKRNIRYYDLYYSMEEHSKEYINNFYLKNDGHPSEAGANYLATSIVRIISDN